MPPETSRSFQGAKTDARKVSLSGPKRIKKGFIFEALFYELFNPGTGVAGQLLSNPLVLYKYRLLPGGTLFSESPFLFGPPSFWAAALSSVPSKAIVGGFYAPTDGSLRVPALAPHAYLPI